MTRILELLCMVSKKNEKHLRDIIKKIILRFQNRKETITQEKMN
jgi:hypothetical protein